MESYLAIEQDRQSGEIEIRAKLIPSEVELLASIRHFLVKYITGAIDPRCEKISFKWGKLEGL